MQILENVKLKGAKHPDVILMIDYKEARIICDAMEEYIKNNKRKVNAKKLYKQMYDDLPY